MTDGPRRVREPAPNASTIAELFPGNMGRLQFVRIMLRLRIPNLHKIDPQEPLDPALLEQLRSAIQEDNRG